MGTIQGGVQSYPEAGSRESQTEFDVFEKLSVVIEILVPPNDPRALAAALHTLLTDPDARAGAIAAGVDRAARFSWEETARLTLDCYRSLAGRSADPPRAGVIR